MKDKIGRDIKMAFIGGSGLYALENMGEVEHIVLDTPYGAPSDKITIGNIDGAEIAFLPRHGRGHGLLPSEVPYAANIYALKSLGVERLVSISAVGSLREPIHPRHVVLPDQLIDRTKGRINTFFGDGIAAHVSFSNPYCEGLRRIISKICSDLGITSHYGGTYVAIEGPQFSTRAESNLYRSWDADIIGMTALPEAKLAREAEICYATVALVTDFDCWKENEGSVNADMIVENLLNNVENSRNVVRELSMGQKMDYLCNCGDALENAIITDLKHVDPARLESIKFLIGKYI